MFETDQSQAVQVTQDALATNDNQTAERLAH